MMNNTTSAQLAQNPMLVAGFVVEYSDRGFTRWLQNFNNEMPFVTNDFSLAKRYKNKKAATKALKKAILANIKWFYFGQIIPVG